MINLSVISSILYICFFNFDFVFKSVPPKCTNKVVVVVVGLAYSIYTKGKAQININ